MNDPNYYQNLANAEAKAFSNANPVEAINQNIRTSPMVEGGTGNTSMGSWRMPKPEPELSLWDQGMKYGSDALKWAEQHPYYTGAAALGAYSLLNKDKPQDKPDPNAQIGDPGFYRPLDIYNMNRQQLGYGDDIYSYGTRGGEAQFFTPTVYEPVRLASGGSVASDNYGYYTYGNIPRTMRGFAKGGLGSLQKRGVFDGRSDDIPAVLSDGEFVVDAETVALLGNGSSKAGADRLEEMRQSVRKQKGGALSRGEFSPDAKSPLAYLKSSKRGRG